MANSTTLPDLDATRTTDSVRTTDVYEQIPGFPKPPLPPLPAWGEFSTLWPENLALTCNETRLLDRVLRLVGFKRFYDQLPSTLETLLRRTNLRTPGLDSLAISASIALQDDPRKPDPYQRAASLVIAARELYLDISTARFPPDTLRGEPLEMGQYPNLFSTSLALERGRVRIYKSECRSKIAVLIRGQFYIIDVGDPESELSQAEFASTLQDFSARVQADQQDKLPVTPALFTCAPDNLQRSAFATLQKSQENSVNLAELRCCFLILCLDLSDYPSSPEYAMRIAHSQNLSNRWFHSSLQIVVFGNSRACTICNFTAYLDGNTMMRGSAELQRRAINLPLEVRSDLSASFLPVHKLLWKIDPDLLNRARTAIQARLDEQQATFVIPDIGRRECNNVLQDPVSFFVLALQMTAFDLVGQMAHISQFLAMNKYRCMDLTIVDVTTPQVCEFVDSFHMANLDRDESFRLFQSASSSIQDISRSARQTISFNLLLTLFIRTRTKIKSILTIPLLRATRIYLNRRHGSRMLLGRDILISHPAIFAEIQAVGRPGVHVPYARFALHYQIFDDRTVITIMPGLEWRVPNQQFVESLHKNMQNLLDLASQGLSFR